MKRTVGIALSAVTILAAGMLAARAWRNGRNGHHATPVDEALTAWWAERQSRRAEPLEVWRAPEVVREARAVDGAGTFV
ncbi:MAG TPA: hypothetical protein VNN07_06120 [Candidatus Tectomicrobia bacterium]|nr:hypothetical protein [Candidatus Tectomicrobia bacterium]